MITEVNVIGESEGGHHTTKVADNGEVVLKFTSNKTLMLKEVLHTSEVRKKRVTQPLELRYSDLCEFDGMLTRNSKSCKAIGCKWVLRKKLKPDGSKDEYKARLVAKGIEKLWIKEETHNYKKVSFILESLLKSFIPFQTNASLNKIKFNLTILLNELQRFQNLTKGKGKEVEANVATTKGKFKRGSSSKSKVGPSKSNRKIEKKGKGKTLKQNKDKKTTEKGKCYHCGENGHWLRNCPKYLAQKKETSSWKKLSEGEITLKVETGEMVLAKAVGDLKIERLVKRGLLSQLQNNSLPPCHSCLEGKMTKRSFTGKGLRAKTPLELVHSDLCEPMNVKARGGYEYFISFIDDYSRYGHVYLIQNKSDSFEKFKEYKAEVENESGKTLKTFRSDQGGEYMDLRFQDYLIEHGIQSQLSAPSTPQQNGVSERRNRTFEAQIIIPDDGIEDPLTYKQAINDVDCDQWIKVIDLEMESMYSNSVWTLVDQQNDVKPIGCKWIYKRKRDQAGKVQTFKARLVMDVKTAFLNRSLEESIYMVQPEGFIQKGQEQNNVDEPCVYKRIINSTVAFLVMYVDDILLIGNDVGHLTDIKKWLATQFQMKDLGNAQYVLGIQIVRNRKNKTLAMSQTSYIDKMLSRYKMQNSKKGLLPYIYGIHLSKEQCPKTPQEVEDMSNISYAFAIGSLMYAMLCTIPDICYSVGIVSRYQSNLGHVRKSISGSIFTLNGGAVVWRSIKQSCIADSTMEAKYVAACEAAKEAVWLKKFLTDLEVVPNMHLPITLYCDNSGAVANSREPRSHKRGKHIERKYHHIRESYIEETLQ
ncbi:gag/pol protein [Cucumis melo var. makuwa]|uniref:Gag/pol protein n=1 Tax=Cucumis melo var. makuwa TaxID=1194695 RepID=A0A5A7VRN6_CUCMM|nr:gag/pol protein [Cucumis melo var. makuwa]